MFPYTSALGRRVAGRRFREGSDDGQGKAHVSAEHSPPGEDPWLPPADADARRAGDPRLAAPQGPEPPQRFRLIRSVRTPGIRKVFRDGQPVHGKRMVLFAAPGSGGFALVAGKKVGGAVERNRARRVLRGGPPGG